MKFFSRKSKYSTSRDYKPFDSLEAPPIVPVVKTVSSAEAEPPPEIHDGPPMSEQEKYYKTLNAVEQARENLRVLESSVPVYCKRCNNKIERAQGRWLDGALGVNLFGGYGMFVDQPDWKFYLCKPCAYDLCNFLNFSTTIDTWGEQK